MVGPAVVGVMASTYHSSIKPCLGPPEPTATSELRSAVLYAIGIAALIALMVMDLSYPGAWLDHG